MFGRAGRVVALGLTVAAGAAMPAWAHGTTERVSIASDGTQANGNIENFSISADGRYVAFNSNASVLVPGDTNGFYDVFVRDRQSGTLERVSVNSSGDPGNGYSGPPAISADGSHVGFVSDSDVFLPPLPPLGYSPNQVFVHRLFR